jgi:hypothetical protein
MIIRFHHMNGRILGSSESLCHLKAIDNFFGGSSMSAGARDPENHFETDIN